MLLPKSAVVPSPLSAQRANAAVVLEAQSQPMAQTAPPIPEMPKAPESPAQKQAAMGIPTLHTYRGDIEQTVQGKKISPIDIAAAQARRGAETPTREEGGLTPPASNKRLWQLGGGAAFIVAAVIIVFFVALSRPAAIPAAAPAVQTFITVDVTSVVPVQTGEAPSELMRTLVQYQQAGGLSLGLIQRLYLSALPTSSPSNALPAELSTQGMFALLLPNAPDELARSLAPQFLLGLHSFSGNLPFLIFKTDNYGQAFAGMLAWETSMQTDLSPLFSRTPSPRFPQQGTTTPATLPQLFNTPFVDRVVENHDTRVMEDDMGNILLLWTFIDRQTLVITNNENTLREIISRLTTAPVISVPGQ